MKIYALPVPRLNSYFYKELLRLEGQHTVLQREHDTLKILPEVDRDAHFRRVAQHRRELRAFRDALTHSQVRRAAASS